jgi:hypothetical protein
LIGMLDCMILAPITDLARLSIHSKYCDQAASQVPARGNKLIAVCSLPLETMLMGDNMAGSIVNLKRVRVDLFVRAVHVDSTYQQFY